MPVTGVKVAVRVRPLNGRERDMKANVCITVPAANKITIASPHEDRRSHTFLYDYAYWSADGSPEKATQEVVYRDLGANVLDNAFEGYNYTIFAYGQTGSGKSYTMMGQPNNTTESGIIPRVCHELFKRMEAYSDSATNATEFQVSLSYLEIYNEKLKDLLASRSKQKELKIRQDPKTGIFVQDLSHHAVRSAFEIQRLIEIGDKNRTVASTNMNATSSRSHSVFTLMFKRISIKHSASGKATGKSQLSSTISLVDLAGSERLTSTGSVGAQFVEGVSINKSLTTLGMVIEALAYNSSCESKRKHKFIPYRDSQLTYLLQDALGGNAMTCMVATVSPADVNYDETLSTLRYADRAKHIKNNVSKNETAQERYIKELEDRVKELEKMLKNGLQHPQASAEEADIRAKIDEYERLLQVTNSNYEKQLEQSARIQKDLEKRLVEMGIELTYGAKVNVPYISNLNADSAMSHTLLFKLGTSEDLKAHREVTTVCGFKMQDSTVTSTYRIKLPSLLGVAPSHFMIRNTNRTITLDDRDSYCLYPKMIAVYVSVLDSKHPVYINGVELTVGREQLLQHGDRILCGACLDSSFFCYNDPIAVKYAADKAKASSLTFIPPEITWEMAHEEYMKYQTGGDHEPDQVADQVDASQELLVSGGADCSGGALGGGGAAGGETSREDFRTEGEKNVHRAIKKMYPYICEANALADFFDYHTRFSLEIRSLIEPDQESNMRPIRKNAIEVVVTDIDEHPHTHEVSAIKQTWSVNKFIQRFTTMKNMYEHAIQCDSKEIALEYARNRCSSDDYTADEFPFDFDEVDEIKFTAHLIGTCRLCLRDIIFKDVHVQGRLQFSDYRGRPMSEIESEVDRAISNTDNYGDVALDDVSNVSIRFHFHKAYGIPVIYTKNVHVVVHYPSFMCNSERPDFKLTEAQENTFRRKLLANDYGIASKPSVEISINPVLDSIVYVDIPARYFADSAVKDWLLDPKNGILLSLYGYNSNIYETSIPIARVMAPTPIPEVPMAGDLDTQKGKVVINARNVIKTQQMPDKEEEAEDGTKVIVRRQIFFIDINKR
ncbi:Kinesin-3 [Giardia muris]|uniref:Kinesin-3 n=1 Tax=Giardia muris TaxID=5742 RepID=A0A4Z1T4M6_GIAMU|nr:Kinesin-3 [Giardia muris]|eukprot:TNJ27479.1 Kinesin-3 [Giardia muris]